MNVKSSLVGAILLLSFSLVPVVQGAPTKRQLSFKSFQPVQPRAQAAEPSAKIILIEGTDVRLKFADALSSKTATEGDSINLVLDEDLKVGDVIVARAVAKAVGSITNAKKGRHDGQGR